MPPRPYTIQVPDAVLAGLRERLARTRWPDEPPGAGWRYGTELGYLRRLCEYWRDGYDWRAHEAALNRFPQFTLDVAGVALHFLHRKSSPRRARGPSAPSTSPA